MLMLSLARAFAALIRWMPNLATWVLARCLNMPEPMVHDTGIFVVAQVQTLENRVGRALCPRAAAASAPIPAPLIPTPTPGENSHDPSVPASQPRPAR